MLRARLVLQRLPGDDPTAKSLQDLVDNLEGGRAIRTVLRKAKSDRLGLSRAYVAQHPFLTIVRSSITTTGAKSDAQRGVGCIRAEESAIILCFGRSFDLAWYAVTSRLRKHRLFRCPGDGGRRTARLPLTDRSETGLWPESHPTERAADSEFSDSSQLHQLFRTTLQTRLTKPHWTPPTDRPSETLQAMAAARQPKRRSPRSPASGQTTKW